MPRTEYYKLKAIENAACLLQRNITSAYQNALPHQPPGHVQLEMYCETAEYVLQCLRIGLGEMSK